MKYIKEVVTIVLVIFSTFSLSGCSEPLEISWNNVAMNENGSQGHVIIGSIETEIVDIIYKNDTIIKSETKENESEGSNYFWNDDGSIIDIETKEDVTNKLKSIPSDIKTINMS